MGKIRGIISASLPVASFLAGVRRQYADMCETTGMYSMVQHTNTITQLPLQVRTTHNVRKWLFLLKTCSHISTDK